MSFNHVHRRWNLSDEPQNYKYSSAKFYYEGIDEFGFLENYMELMWISMVANNCYDGKRIVVGDQKVCNYSLFLSWNYLFCKLLEHQRRKKIWIDSHPSKVIKNLCHKFHEFHKLRKLLKTLFLNFFYWTSGIKKSCVIDLHSFT